MTKERAVTTQKLFKRRVRQRLAKTGESYAAARRHVATDRDQLEAARSRLASAKELASDEKLAAATGRDWAAWLAILDGWGARARTHRDIVQFLSAEHGVPGWWTQTITNGYERARALRAKHQQSSGFTIYASKTVGVPLSSLFAAFVDEGLRARWLTDGSMSLRTSQRDRTARFDWGDGTTRILVTFEAKGPSKASAHVSHERLPDADVAEIAKSLWKKRVSVLKRVLEATDG
jgi:hypothetical protein